jgi:hypothetical protein
VKWEYGVFDLFQADHIILVKQYTSKYAKLDRTAESSVRTIEDVFGSDGYLVLLVQPADSRESIQAHSTVSAIVHSNGCNESSHYINHSKRERGACDTSIDIMEGDDQQLKSKLKRMDMLASCFHEHSNSPDDWIDDDEDEEVMYRYEESDNDDGGYIIVADDSVDNEIE